MHCLEIYPATEKQITFLRKAVTDNWIDSPFYQRKQKASPFLQGCTNDFILIEFWYKDLDEIKNYVNFLKEEWEKEE
jgi:hypothetical protein